MFSRERTIEVNVQDTDFFALFAKDLGNFFSSLSTAAHHNNDIFCISSAGVVEEFIITASQLADFFHVFFNDFRQGIIVFVDSFASLEVDIRVLSRTAGNRVIRIQGMFAEFIQCFVVNQFSKVIIVQKFNLLDFVGSTEPIEEVQERNMTFNSSQMGNSGQVHDFLYAGFSKKCKTGLAASHNVSMVAEDVQGAGSQCTSSDVENCRKQFTSDLIHVRNHQEQTLGCGIGGGQCTSGKGAVYSTGSTSFGLHFHDLDRTTKDVLLSMGSPFIADFSHRRRRSDRVDCGNITERIGSIRSGGVTIHGLKFFCHCSKPLFLRKVTDLG